MTFMVISTLVLSVQNRSVRSTPQATRSIAARSRRPSHAALADFLSCGGYDSHLRRIRRTFAENIDQMIRAIARSFPSGTKVSRPAGGFVLWVELPKPIDGHTLFDEALQHGICFTPGNVFSASGRYGHCLRLSCGHGWDRRIEAGVTTLGALASATQASGSPVGSYSGTV